MAQLLVFPKKHFGNSKKLVGQPREILEREIFYSKNHDFLATHLMEILENAEKGLLRLITGNKNRFWKRSHHD
jgi:hypothetical protein